MNLKCVQSTVAVLVCGVLAVGPLLGQTQSFTLGHDGDFVQRLTSTWRPHAVAQASFEDSPRLEKLMRAGSIYLSLRDAIALALENNLDIEYARFNPRLSEANLKRVSSGALLRNVASS